MLKETKSDDFLFGKGLTEKIKESKTIQKLSREMKNQSISKDFISFLN